MSTKAQHALTYRSVPALLRTLREEAELTQRELGAKLRQPQSWVHNCETANRRVDVAEFCRWAKACGIDPLDALARLLKR